MKEAKLLALFLIIYIVLPVIEVQSVRPIEKAEENPEQFFSGLESKLKDLEDTVISVAGDVTDLVGEVGDAVGGFVDEVGDDLGGIVTEVEEGIEEITDEVKKKVDKHMKKLKKMNLNPRTFLEKFGYLKKKDTNKHSMKSVGKALKNFQKMYHMKLTGLLDMSTLEAMTKDRCGMPDMLPPDEEEEGEGDEGKVTPGKKKKPHTLKRTMLQPEAYSAKPYKWNKKDLTYRIGNYSSTSQLSTYVQKRAFVKALKYWEAVSGLTFSEAPSGSSADININFATRNHGDGVENAFDGKGGVLAHAYYPTSGEAHFDDEEIWTDGTNAGTDLNIVAAHEFGHALGLGHSDVEGALMEPFYQGYEENFKLRPDDIAGIRKLYGDETSKTIIPPPEPEKPINPPEPEPKPPEPKPAGPDVAPNSCSVQFTAAVQLHDQRVYFFNGDWVWRVSEYGLDYDYPRKISQQFLDAPSYIDAAHFSWSTYYTYFFKGREIWVYRGSYFIKKLLINTYGFPSRIQAAIPTSSGKICLLKDIYCWMFDESTQSMASYYPERIDYNYPNLLTSYDSLLTLKGEPYLYFFIGSSYDKYDTERKGLLQGYPRVKAGPWMGPECGGRAYTPR